MDTQGIFAPLLAASALLGYMGPPGELGLSWEPELFEV